MPAMYGCSHYLFPSTLTRRRDWAYYQRLLLYKQEIMFIMKFHLMKDHLSYNLLSAPKLMFLFIENYNQNMANKYLNLPFLNCPVTRFWGR